MQLINVFKPLKVPLPFTSAVAQSSLLPLCAGSASEASSLSLASAVPAPLPGRP